jgi:hypothetical protein
LIGAGRGSRSPPASRHPAIRLLVVTAFLTRTRVGGGGAFVGAVAFPLLALLFGWLALRLWRGSRLP